MTIALVEKSLGHFDRDEKSCIEVGKSSKKAS